MSDDQPDSFSKLWDEAIDEHLAQLSPAELRARIERVRQMSDDYSDIPVSDVTARHKRIAENMAAKTAQLRRVPADHNGALGTGLTPVDLTRSQPQPPKAPQPGLAPNRAQARAGGPPPNPQHTTAAESIASKLREHRNA
ncbi:hypothetical protein [Mycobacterium xenopi]|uniref:Uncharacterized protein n=1 Tax=Mycobacterium xenopi TaxID=1789 RepID=A0AAD1H1B5_MYCXE|nr:hypothetical protein [Mycobacterium xenopi]MDA3639833.1 hypothetical protein [Mycobacterium xenopi]MDA3658193.1 hypothetical protein [Mycobacterium xenopi]MDA3661845.1 hypothetical protein [Mycobacterium xenopi]ORX21437.1 hypothetical protein AWC32_23290 [Mycobacterium xenopi]SPX88926.1 Uncharacterised protein [Mycobacterium xenopi]